MPAMSDHQCESDASYLPPMTKDSKLNTESHDGTVRIHRRRPGMCQPKDSLGLSCILQENNADKELLGRRKMLIMPQDNIGISCLPTKDDSNKKKTSDAPQSNDAKDTGLDADQHKIIETDEYLTRLRGGADWTSLLNSEIVNLNSNMKEGNNFNEQKIERHNTMNDIGISNIRRPKGDKLKPRKPILPKDNIEMCCRLLQKSTIFKSGIGNVEKKITKVPEKQKSVLQDQISSNLKVKQGITSATKRLLKTNIKERKGLIWK